MNCLPSRAVPGTAIKALPGFASRLSSTKSVKMTSGAVASSSKVRKLMLTSHPPP